MEDIDTDIPVALGTSYKNRHNPVQSCFEAALIRGYLIFAVQDGGKCFGLDVSKHSLTAYRKFGAATGSDGTTTRCYRGKGGVMANSIYEKIKGKPFNH